MTPEKFQSQKFKAARCCVRRRADAKDAGEAAWFPASESLGALDGMPSVALGKTPADDRLFL